MAITQLNKQLEEKSKKIKHLEREKYNMDYEIFLNKIKENIRDGSVIFRDENAVISNSLPFS